MSSIALEQKIYTGFNPGDLVGGLLRPLGNKATTESAFHSDLQLPETLSHQREESKARLLARLRTFAELPLNWDGYGGVPASLQAFEDATSFIHRLPLNARMPRTMIAGNGEISVCWEDGDKYLEASFSGDQTFHYFFDAPAPVGAGDDIQVSCGIPEALKAIIIKHFV